MSATTAYVKAAYGNSPDVLADFGIQTKARVPLTVDAKLTAAAKRAATRAARHTMGKRQKNAIKGDVTGVLVTPVTSTPTPTVPTPVSPATAVTSGGNDHAPTPTPADP
jgi:hypothetical protein